MARAMHAFVRSLASFGMTFLSNRVVRPPAELNRLQSRPYVVSPAV